jgi:hypothetical protein
LQGVLFAAGHFLRPFCLESIFSRADRPAQASRGQPSTLEPLCSRYAPFRSGAPLRFSAPRQRPLLRLLFLFPTQKGRPCEAALFVIYRQAPDQLALGAASGLLITAQPSTTSP